MSVKTAAAGQREFVTIIEPSRGWVALQLRELWAFRELLYFLAWREIKVRYKQTAIGAAWALLQPLLNMLVFSLFFGKLAKMPSDGIPYPIFSLTGLVIWTFFANGLSLASNSMVINSNLISKVYFPRLTVPISAVLSGIVDFGLSFGFLVCMIAFNRIVPTARILWLPAFVLLAFVAALGLSLWLAALNVEYRDVRYVIPFIIQFWMLATPIAYPSSLLHEPWRSLYGLNPMAGAVEGFRWCLLGAHTSPGPILAVSTAATILITISGAYYFRRMEQTFADLV
jgi:lipopolysaccharide transport system permease protein